MWLLVVTSQPELKNAEMRPKEAMDPATKPDLAAKSGHDDPQRGNLRALTETLGRDTRAWVAQGESARNVDEAGE